MDDSNPFLIVLLILLVIASAFFSASETAYSSLNKIRLKSMCKHDKKAELALRLSEEYDKLLSTILIGNNVVNITSASVSTIIFVGFFGNMGVTLSTVVMTVVVLIFGEITPKSLAKESPERLAIAFSHPLHAIMVMLTPLNFLFKQWKKLVAKLFKSGDKHSITEEELITMVSEAQHEGGINEQEGELIRNAIEFNDLDAREILTPRVDVEAVEINDTADEIARVFMESGYSRLPVYDGNIDSIAGVINEKDFHHKVAHDGGSDVRSILKPVLHVAPSVKISMLLKLLQQSKSHIAVVTDEYGGTLGIVTLEDILEELVGDIWDEHDEKVEQFEKLSDTEYRIFCGTNSEILSELFGIYTDEGCISVGGWVTERFGRIPSEGESICCDGVTVTVTKVERMRVLEIIVACCDNPSLGLTVT